MEQFNCIDEFYENAEGWDLEFKQLSGGELQAKLEILSLNDTFLYYCSYNKKLLQIGSLQASSKAVSFAISPPDSPPSRWCNHNLDGAFMREFSCGHEWELFSDPGYSAFVLNIPIIKFEMIASKLGHLDTFTRKEPFKVHYLHKVEQIQLCKLAVNIFSSPTSLKKELLIEEFTTKIIKISTRNSMKENYLTPNFLHLFDKIVNFIYSNIERNIKINEILYTFGISRRTLEYYFYNHIGVSPKKFIKYLKLNFIHMELSKNNFLSISDIAQKYNFKHMNHFSKDFKSLFHYLPSHLIFKRD